MSFVVAWFPGSAGMSIAGVGLACASQPNHVTELLGNHWPVIPGEARKAEGRGSSKRCRDSFCTDIGYWVPFPRASGARRG